MLTVEEYGRIRRAHRNGMSVREIARTYHHSRRKVRQVLEEAEPQPYTRREDPWAPELGPLKPVIEADVQVLHVGQAVRLVRAGHVDPKLEQRLRSVS